MSICQALLTQVAEIAADRGASSVAQVIIEVGPLAGVDPGLLASAFAVMRAGGCAAEASLVIESTRIRVTCLSCGAESPATPSRLTCAACGGYRTQVVAGEELCLRRVELRIPAPRPACVA